MPRRFVDKVICPFHNDKPYKIVVIYNNSATAGLTAEDMVEAISAKYSAATTPLVETNSPESLSYRVTDAPIAEWEGAESSITRSRASFLNTFQLVMFTRQIEDQAEAAMREAARQEREDALQKEIARMKKGADDLETARQTNVKAFRTICQN